MLLLLVTFTLFIAFVLFQTVYILVPLFKNEKKKRIPINRQHSFSIIVPAYNEEKVIENCIHGYLHQAHRDAELIIVNDGSTDSTFDVLKELLDLHIYHRPGEDDGLIHKEVINLFRSSLHPSIYVLDKVNGGKADALNAGITFSRNDLVVTLDADSILGEDALVEMNAAFQDHRVIACGGNVLISQAFSGEIGNLKPTFTIPNVIRYQFLQYLTAFLLHKRAQAAVGAITVIAGAFGTFRRETLFHIQGFRSTIGEDMDITLKLHRWIEENGRSSRIAFVPSAVCYTECPDTLKSMFKQRVRWQKAFIDCLIHYRSSYFTRFSWRFSLFFLVDQFIIGTLNAFTVIAAPVVFIFRHDGMTLFLLLGLTAVLLFMYQSIITIYISRLHGIRFSKRDIIRILCFLPVEIGVYRMINLVFVVYGTLSYFHQPQSWDKFERTGTVGCKGVKRA